ncbi:MAG: succinyl-CoA synthetase subunit beta [Methanocalculus sp. MSAO_Arc1]|uniref:succinate--CoA ligase subunit beta n=1 Tax=Methanocalculus TaxID=71151 RepID=UPI000FF0BC3C|nr:MULTISPECIES: ATP-grasp domain-containing protein [unclassified Methanocalculus]MCP1663209.1 succinyl-CoA synthetase beta subunit [Methanocalculus sp. AMF5]RQD80706.1 MAG: succinyl-CoA synthetase subunit beta [Methanocalculus sp. MSAO_Arc1]
MKLREYEAKKVFSGYGIAVPESVLIRSPGEALDACSRIHGDVVLKAQVDVGGRGLAGGILMATESDAASVADELFRKEIKGLSVQEVLVEQRLEIEKEYFLSIAIDRSRRSPVILFAEAGGVEIESTAGESPDIVRRAYVSPHFKEVPGFILRYLTKGCEKEVASVISGLYRAFLEKDALLAEINPLVITPQGVLAADAKLIIDDNALNRQGICENRDLTEREAEAETHGFSYVELDGSIGVIGNGAGLTMATLDLIAHHQGRAANFLDVGGGAGSERVMHAVRLVASVPSVQVIVVNLLGGITRCDEVARGIIDAGVSQQVIVRLAGTNEAEGRALLEGAGYRMLDTMEEAVASAVQEASS